MNWYLTLLTKNGRTIEHGWMLARHDNELVDYARQMGYSIAVTFLGKADMTAVVPTIVRGTESEAALIILGENHERLRSIGGRHGASAQGE